MQYTRQFASAFLIAAWITLPTMPASAADSVPAGTVAATPTDATAKAQAVVDKALDFLKSQQKPDGGWAGEKMPPAISALVLKAFAQEPKYGGKADFVAKGYQQLLTFQVADGGIYKDLLANYNTAISVSALAAARDPALQPQIDKAVNYLKGLQWTPEMTSAEGEAVKDAKDAWYGGFGYGGRSRGGGRPDLSNVSLALDALHDAGLKPEDPTFQRAVAFASRVQNLSETNDQPWAGNDGGFVYGPGDKRAGESMAGEYTSPDGRRMLRSYGSMTYAGLKSFLYAGLGKQDPRVKAAWDWITKNWSLEENPGMKLNKPEMATSGLYYYYHTLARALNAYDEPTIIDPQGVKHDWRAELIDKLATLQKPDGSFVGDKRWMEDNAVLTTSYVVLALQEAKENLKLHAVAK